MSLPQYQFLSLWGKRHHSGEGQEKALKHKSTLSPAKNRVGQRQYSFQNSEGMADISAILKHLNDAGVVLRISQINSQL